MINITVPDLGGSKIGGTLTKWWVEEGSSLEGGDVTTPSQLKSDKEKAPVPSSKEVEVPKVEKSLDNKTKSLEPVISNFDEPSNNESEKSVPMSKLRQTIARRLKDAQNTAAILTTFNEVDMTAIMALRKKQQTAFQKKHGVKLGIMSFFVKACVQVLKELPEINSEIFEDKIIYKNYFDIGVAIGSEKGLVVPIIRNAEKLSNAEIEKEIINLATKANSNKLAMKDLSGGTFSITNGGVYGSMMSTPIINPPQSAILGMHSIIERPIAVKNKVVIRPMMYTALSYDHRLIDGRQAVTFLVRLKEILEDPKVD